jgi:hypothetical protein
MVVLIVLVTLWRLSGVIQAPERCQVVLLLLQCTRWRVGLLKEWNEAVHPEQTAVVVVKCGRRNAVAAAGRGDREGVAIAAAADVAAGLAVGVVAANNAVGSGAGIGKGNETMVADGRNAQVW